MYWVGCMSRSTRATSSTTLRWRRSSQAAGVNFAILGNEETCSGDPARRAGNEYLFQILAQQHRDARTSTASRRSSTAARTASTRSRTSTRSSAATTRSSTTASSSGADRRGPACKLDPDIGGGARQGDLPRPVLPGPLQRGLRRAARRHAALPGASCVEMPRCREQASAAAPAAARAVHGGKARHAHQPHARARSHRHRRRAAVRPPARSA